MAEKQTKGKDDSEKLFAFLCYLISIIGVVIVLATKSERSHYSIYHAKQGLVLFIVEIVVCILWAIIVWIPIIGMIIGWILWVLVVILWVIGMINSLTDKEVPLPVIGSFGEKFKF
jgi:uncharacterized membrane protein